MNINKLIKGNEQASDQIYIQERDESNDSKAQFLTSFIQDNPIDSSVNIRRTMINESGWSSNTNFKAKNSQSSVDQLDSNMGAHGPLVDRSSAIMNVCKQSQSARRQAAARARKNNLQMAYSIGVKKVSGASYNAPHHNVNANKNPSNPNLVMATWSNLQKADARAGKATGSSRNTAFKTNSVHSIRLKKAAGMSGELYGFNTM